MSIKQTTQDLQRVAAPEYAAMIAANDRFKRAIYNGASGVAESVKAEAAVDRAHDALHCAARAQYLAWVDAVDTAVAMAAQGYGGWCWLIPDRRHRYPPASWKRKLCQIDTASSREARSVLDDVDDTTVDGVDSVVALDFRITH